MSYSLRRVFGEHGVLCEKTDRLLAERDLNNESELYLEDADDSDGSTSDGSASGPDEGHVHERRARSVNRDDIVLTEWRRLAGIE